MGHPTVSPSFRVIMAAKYFTDAELLAFIDASEDNDDDMDPDFRPNESDEDGESSDEENATLEGGNEAAEAAPSATPDVGHQAAITDIEEGTRRARSHVRDPSKWKRNMQKRRRNSGEEYISLSNKKIPKRKLEHIDCGCKKQCVQKISEVRRLQLHESFWDMGDWSAQNAFLVGLVKRLAVNRHDKRDRRGRNPGHVVGPMLPRPKEVTRHYFLSDSNGVDKEVCKQFFLKTFSVSNGRISRAFGNAIGAGSPTRDKRGHHVPGNKTEVERTDHLKTFIEDIPQYESHYTRARHVDRKYLAPGLTLAKLYDLYQERCTLDSVQPVSDWKFRDTFNTDFSFLSFHQPLKDTCKTCDILALQIKEAEQTGDEVKLAQKKNEKELHLRRAEAAQTGYRTDCEKTKTDDVTVFCYDLQKTLPTPVLTTGIVYYKRQMWVYNLGIHDAEKKNGFMYMWDESQGSRGPNEIASCLYKHLTQQKPKKCIIAYADTCGGQNRNIKNALFWLHVVQNPLFDVELVHQKFFVSGHSWMDSDKDFGVIEKAKPGFPHIFVPDHWVEVVQKSKKKNPFVVTKLQQTDVKSLANLENAIVNRKVDTDGVKVEWLKIHWLCFKREYPKKIFFKYSNNEAAPFRCVDLSRIGGPQHRRSIDLGAVVLPGLYPQGRQIAAPKLKDLQSLLQFVPPVHHAFYSNLRGDVNANDGGLVEEQDIDENDG